MENSNPNIIISNNNNRARVQHVAKPSSDQLLSKFAEVGEEDERPRISVKKELRLAKRIKRSSTQVTNNNIIITKHCAADNNSNGNLADGNSLLASTTSCSNKSSSVALVRNKLGMSKANKMRAKEIKTKSIISALQKTWRRTVEGASRVLMEKHYNRHKRLINDMYY